jgi:hypothetical protein
MRCSAHVVAAHAILQILISPAAEANQRPRSPQPAPGDVGVAIGLALENRLLCAFACPPGRHCSPGLQKRIAAPV